jgi:hypothetical protein
VGSGKGNAWWLEIDVRDEKPLQVYRADGGTATLVASANSDTPRDGTEVAIDVAAGGFKITIDGKEIFDHASGRHSDNTHVGLGDGPGMDADFLDDFSVAISSDGNADTSGQPGDGGNPPAKGPHPQPNPEPEPANPIRSLRVEWTAPTRNTDGSPLTDLAGFRIYYGTERDRPFNVLELSDPAQTRHTFNLTSGTYFIEMTAFDLNGNESAPSNRLVRTVP